MLKLVWCQMWEFRGIHCMSKWTPWMKKSQPLFHTVSKNLFLNSLCLFLFFLRNGFPLRRQRRISVCIPSCSLTSVMGCINPALLHSLVFSFSPLSLSLCSQTKFVFLREKLGGVGSLEKASWHAG